MGKHVLGGREVRLGFEGVQRGTVCCKYLLLLETCAVEGVRLHVIVSLTPLPMLYTLTLTGYKDNLTIRALEGWKAAACCFTIAALTACWFEPL